MPQFTPSNGRCAPFPWERYSQSLGISPRQIQGPGALTSFLQSLGPFPLHSFPPSRCCYYFLGRGRKSQLRISPQDESLVLWSIGENAKVGLTHQCNVCIEGSNYWVYTLSRHASMPSSCIRFLGFCLMTLGHPFIMGRCKGFLHYCFRGTIIALGPPLQSAVPDSLKYNKDRKSCTVISGANHEL